MINRNSLPCTTFVCSVLQLVYRLHAVHSAHMLVYVYDSIQCITFSNGRYMSHWPKKVPVADFPNLFRKNEKMKVLENPDKIALSEFFEKLATGTFFSADGSHGKCTACQVACAHIAYSYGCSTRGHRKP